MLRSWAPTLPPAAVFNVIDTGTALAAAMEPAAVMLKNWTPAPPVLPAIVTVPDVVETPLDSVTPWRALIEIGPEPVVIGPDRRASVPASICTAPEVVVSAVSDPTLMLPGVPPTVP